MAIGPITLGSTQYTPSAQGSSEEQTIIKPAEQKQEGPSCVSASSAKRPAPVVMTQNGHPMAPPSAVKTNDRRDQANNQGDGGKHPTTDPRCRPGQARLIPVRMAAYAPPPDGKTTSQLIHTTLPGGGGVQDAAKDDKPPRNDGTYKPPGLAADSKPKAEVTTQETRELAPPSSQPSNPRDAGKAIAAEYENARGDLDKETNVAEKSKKAQASFDKMTSQLAAAKSSLKPSEYADVVRGFVDGSGYNEDPYDNQLAKIATDNKGGDQLLTQMASALPQGDKDRTQLESASKSAVLSQTVGQEFAGEASHHIREQASDAKAVDNIVSFVNSPQYQAISNRDVREQMLKAVDQHPRDKVFREGLQKLVDNNNFKALSRDQQNRAIQAYSQVAANTGYNGHNYVPWSPLDHTQRRILYNAERLITSPGFSSAGSKDQESALKVLSDHAQDRTTAANLAAMMHTVGFKAADDRTKQAWFGGNNQQAGSASKPDAATTQQKLGQDTIELQAARTGDQKVELRATLTGMDGVKTTTSLGIYDIDASKPLDVKASQTADGHILNVTLQDGGSPIQVKDDVAETSADQVRLATRTHTLTSPGGTGQLTTLSQVGLPSQQRAKTEVQYQPQALLTLTQSGVAQLPDSKAKQDAQAFLQGVNKDDPEAMARVARLKEAISTANNSLTALNAWGNHDRPELANVLNDARNRQLAAVSAAVSGSQQAYESARTEADQATRAVPQRMAAALVREGGLIDEQIGHAKALEKDISKHQDKDPTGIEAERRQKINKLLGITTGADGKPIETVSQQTETRVQQLRQDLANGDPEASERIIKAYADNQRKISNLSIVAMREQVHQTTEQITGTFGQTLDAIDNTSFKLGRSDRQGLGHGALQRQQQFDGYIDQLNAAEQTLAESQDPQKREAAIEQAQAVYKDFGHNIEGFYETQFPDDFKRMQDRVQEGDAFRTQSIVAVATLPAGMAGRLVDGAVAWAGASRLFAGGAGFTAETLTFTGVNTGLQQLGGKDVNFWQEAPSDGLMFGSMRAASSGFGWATKSFAEDYKLATAAGHKAVELGALQGFSEAQYMAETGHMMSADERQAAFLTNLGMMAGFQAGGKVLTDLPTENAKTPSLTEETINRWIQTSGKANDLNWASQARNYLRSTSDFLHDNPVREVNPDVLTHMTDNGDVAAVFNVTRGENGELQGQILSRSDLQGADKWIWAQHEPIHVQQMNDPAMRPKMEKLADLDKRWDTMSNTQKLDAYRANLELEQDAYQRMTALQTDPERMKIVQQEQSHITEQVAALNRGEVKAETLRPPYLMATKAGQRYKQIVSSVDGLVVGEYDALNSGPLPHGRAETFSGGRYAEITLNRNTVVYRAWSPGTWAAEDGAFWSLEPPQGALQTRVDSALLPEWGGGKPPFNPNIRSQATNWTSIELPKGTTVYVGEVGGQNGVWVGGGSQLLIKGGPNLAWKIGGGLLK